MIACRPYYVASLFSLPLAEKAGVLMISKQWVGWLNSMKAGFWHEAGQDLIEYALILPLLLALILSIIDFSLLIFDYNTIANAAREGARTGIIPSTAACNTACIDAKVVTSARRLTTGLKSGSLTVAVDRSVANTIRVTVTYNAPTIAGGALRAFTNSTTIPDSLLLRTVATMRLE